MKKDIENLEDIKQLVDSFYASVRADELIGPVFNSVIQDRWPEHLGKMYRFWQTVLLEEQTYKGSPFPLHANLPIERKHFERWLTLFYRTINERFSGKKAEETKWRSAKMAEMFLAKIQYYQTSNAKPIQ